MCVTRPPVCKQAVDAAFAAVLFEGDSDELQTRVTVVARAIVIHNLP